VGQAFFFQLKIKTITLGISSSLKKINKRVCLIFFQLKKGGSGVYRYGFNGKENDNDIKGEGNQQDYGMRIYDPRVGRFLSVDPITKKYPELTPYQFASNTPIAAIDLDGLEAVLPKIIGTTRAKLIKLTNSEIENNLNLLNLPGLSTGYLKALLKEEGLSLTMYDIDRKPSELNSIRGRGGNATIGFGHLVHYGAIGSDQYDPDAFTKEKQFEDGLTVSDAFSLLSEDLTSRFAELVSSLKKNKINNPEQGIVDLFMDLKFNTGSPNNAIRIYKNNGALGLKMALMSNKTGKNILKNINDSRRKMRLRLIEREVTDENFKHGVDDVRKINNEKKSVSNVALLKSLDGKYSIEIVINNKYVIIITG
jgi:RHS repeat-associated protein